ncbi:HXXEE domain-containing protein [Nannocystis pusilla]|uniref:HXXEE domain-containing protein n=1 Tax=Nannocystis pusilla TaxID=889268 RepID=UPI003DA42017
MTPERDPFSPLLWLCVPVYGLHIMEELAFGWLEWAHSVGMMFPGWSTFYVTNAVVIVIGVTTAMLGWRMPACALVFPALMVINALLFHLLPSLTGGHPNPGCISAMVFFLPLAALTFREAWRAGVRAWQTYAAAALIAGGLQLWPVLLLKLSPMLAAGPAQR